MLFIINHSHPTSLTPSRLQSMAVHTQDTILNCPCTPGKGCGRLGCGRDMGVPYFLEQMKNFVSSRALCCINQFDSKIRTTNHVRSLSIIFIPLFIDNDILIHNINRHLTVHYFLSFNNTKYVPLWRRPVWYSFDLSWGWVVVDLTTLSNTLPAVSAIFDHQSVSFLSSPPDYIFAFSLLTCVWWARCI